MTPTIWALIACQLIMGAADTLIHHELGERLAWRVSQRREIRLHGIRNLFYAVIFALLGLYIPGGYIAGTLAFILAAEIAITLWDFVEEDRTRTLPASERVLHTLMALNYGAILICIAPIIAGWMQTPTALESAEYGLWGWMMCAAALAVFIFGLRDLFAAKRLGQMAAHPIKINIRPSKSAKHVLITGGTGFIGRALVPALQAAGYRITVLTRDAKNAAHLKPPFQLITDLTQIPSGEKIDIIINLAGAPIAKLWTKDHRAAMVQSRINTTRNINALIARLEQKPELLLSGSAIGVYGETCTLPVLEEDEIDIDGSFAQQLCRAWEAEAQKSGIRTALLRTGIVLDTDGGTLAQMLVPTELGGGAVLGSGRQIMSWISRRDIVRLIAHILQDGSISGPVNAVTTRPASNADFTQALAASLRRPVTIKIPAFALRALGGLGREIFLGSQTVLPGKAVQTGFIFQDTDLETTFGQMFGKHRAAAIRVNTNHLVPIG